MFVQKVRAVGKAGTGLAVIGLVFGGLTSSAGTAQAVPGAVYAMTNGSTGNAIMAFTREADGTLSPGGTFSTGGLGLGTSLGSQGALILSTDGHFLFAVNAGSNDVSVLAVEKGGLRLVDRAPSGGTEPISLTLYKNLLYVVNAGGTPNIVGFTLEPDGALLPLADSSRPLAGGISAGPAEVSFTPDGSFLVVTEKNTNLIDTYRVLPSGLTVGPLSNTSHGTEPFGFAFGSEEVMVVSEAFTGGAGLGAASSYRIQNGGKLVTVSGSVPDTQTAPCWVVISNNGHIAYASNTGSGTISTYRVHSEGFLKLINATAGSTGTSSAPTDEALSANSRFLYVLDSATGNIDAFEADGDGQLTALAGAGGLPTTAEGIAAE